MEIGVRISEARITQGLSQQDLAERLRIDRSAVTRIEAGERKVSATELVELAEILDRPIDWFVYESSPAVVSRRREAASIRQVDALDGLVERVARDVDYLVDEGIVPPSQRGDAQPLDSFEEAEALAESMRAALEVLSGPLLDLQQRAEELGVLAFSLPLGEGGPDASYVEAGGWGVAVLNGDQRAGRRRFNLAHEIGHHLVGDDFSTEIEISPFDDTERMINAFAAHLLLPRADMQALWKSEPSRLTAVAISVDYRCSWRALVGHLRTLQLIDAEERDRLFSAPPREADFVDLGRSWIPELNAPSVPPLFGRRVLAGYRSGKLTVARTVELLNGTVPENQLEELDAMPVESLSREFDPFPVELPDGGPSEPLL